METDSSSEPLDLVTIRSRVRELEQMHRNCMDEDVEMSSSDPDQSLVDSALQLESKVQQMISECSDFSFLGIEDLDAFVEHLKEELNTAEAESAKISNEIEVLTRTHIQDSSRLESDLEVLKSSLDSMSSQVQEDKDGQNYHSYVGDGSNSINSHENHEFEILKLDNQIEESKSILNSLQNFEYLFKRFDALEEIEDALSGLHIIEFDGTFIRLSLRTYIPKLEGMSQYQSIDDTFRPSEVNHELLIEVLSGTMEIKTVEIFPNDVYIGDIVDAAKTSRESFPQLSLPETRSSIQWLVRKVQDRIIQCTLRRLLVKTASNSRYSLEYLDRDETILAHLVGGVDAYIKVYHGWPISSSPLKLISLKSSGHHSKEISLSFLCKVEGVVNSLSTNLRENLSSFVDAVETILKEQMRLDIHSDSTSQK
ncbi:hypothetical protein K2173_019274 [Erythroxylum novogranatense]|uniref:Uncharacterized protein n=1 Tax=Erythroxylum novogranatense TaxID=1862640 RepID=A0AAV8STZ1_9ROSI|nr:hypothetical protein K2173_019274 [Erythroxylum novogranatense]